MDDATEAAMDTEIVGPIAGDAPTWDDVRQKATEAAAAIGVDVVTDKFTLAAFDAAGQLLPPDRQTEFIVATLKSDPFVCTKEVTFKDGPQDGMIWHMLTMPSDGLICFFCESSPGVIQQAVYKIILKEIEPTDSEKAAAEELKQVLPKRYEWVGEYMGKRRHTPPQNVNGCRKV